MLNDGDDRSMAYDEDLADRLRVATQHESNLTEQRMFGGLAFLVNGNMAVAASSKGDLMVRVDPTQTSALIAEPGVARMEMGSRKMNGWVRVDLDVIEQDSALQRWVDLGAGYARSLPGKR